MTSPLLLLLCLITSLASVNSQRRCDPSYCNNAGICSIVQGKNQCKCIGTKYFTGAQCNEKVDHCAANPCKNNAKCIKALGQYLCDQCPVDFGGQHCDVRNNQLFTKWFVLSNYYADYAQELVFLVTVETLGKSAFICEFFNEEYLIDSFVTNPMESLAKSRWQKSNNLVAIARQYGLQHAAQMPYRKGYYHVMKHRFWKPDEVTLQMIVVDAEDALVYEHSFTLQIVQPESIACIPDIRFLHGENPRQPLQLDIARYNMFEPVVRKRCASKSSMKYHWTVYNSIGTVELHKFGYSKGSMLKVPPYRLWFQYHGEIMQSYLVRLLVTENYGDHQLQKEVRCYVFVESKPVIATIRGGGTREVSANKPLQLDGSKSRDFALSPKSEQKMRCQWHCSSTDDPDNKFCRPGIGSGLKLNIAAEHLNADKTYTFTLAIRSLVNIYSNDVAKQIVKVVAGEPHYVDIDCVRNCLDEKFTVGKLLHLRGKCISCGATEKRSYAWTVAGQNIGSKQRVLYETKDVAELTLELIVTSGNRQGKASIVIEKNEPPAGGSCSIAPTSGVEYETVFHITCEDYVDKDLPLWYQYVAGDFTFDRTSDPNTEVRLPQLNSLKVLICDFLLACTEVELTVSVSAMQLPSDAPALKELFARDESNMHKLLVNSDIERAMVLADILTKKATTLAITELICEQLRDFELHTLLTIEQLTKVTRNLIEPLKPLDNKKVAQFAKLFGIIAQGFATVVKDGEVRELLDDSYTNLMTALIDMLAEFSVHLEAIPEVQSIRLQGSKVDDRLVESYPNFADFDVTVLERVNNWLRAIHQSFRCIHYIGVAATNMHEPGEAPLVISRDQMVSEIFSFESVTAMVIETKDKAVSAYLSAPMLAELLQKLKSDHIILHVVSLKINPFWWYPDEQPLSTTVFYFSACSSADTSASHRELKNPFEFDVKLLPANNTTTEPMVGHVENRLDMPIYQIIVPKNSGLIVKFVEASAKLRVMLQLGIKPRGYEVQASQIIILPSNMGSPLHIINNKAEEVLAYLAIRADGVIQTKAKFAFSIDILQCLSWDFTLAEPQWSTAGCRPTFEDTKAGSLRCNCFHISIFAGKIYPTVAELSFGERILLEDIPTNWNVVLFYAVIAALLAAILLWSSKRRFKNKENLIIEITDAEKYSNFGIVVHITTGGQWNAGTTANVTLSLAMRRRSGMTRDFIMYQNPEDPHLMQNSTCTVKLPITGADIAKPLHIKIHHDNAGRYPTWYCRSVVVEDLLNEQTHKFSVEQWITTQTIDLKEPREGVEPEARIKIFRDTLEGLCISWFQFQPLFGPWRYGDVPFNRFERTCIWVSKLAVTICIVACYFGKTTYKTYEEEREMYGHISFEPWKLLALCTGCYLAGVFVEVVLKYIIIYDL